MSSCIVEIIRIRFSFQSWSSRSPVWTSWFSIMVTSWSPFWVGFLELSLPMMLMRFGFTLVIDNITDACLSFVDGISRRIMLTCWLDGGWLLQLNVGSAWVCVLVFFVGLYQLVEFAVFQKLFCFFKGARVVPQQFMQGIAEFVISAFCFVETTFD